MSNQLKQLTSEHQTISSVLNMEGWGLKFRVSLCLDSRALLDHKDWWWSSLSNVSKDTLSRDVSNEE